MRQFKYLLTGLGLTGAMALSPALACTCPPLPDAAAQAEDYDFIGVVTVGESIALPSQRQIAAEEAMQSFLAERSSSLYDYVKAKEAGEDTRTLEEWEDDFLEASTFFPHPPSPGANLTQMKVQRVLKGENTSALFVRHSDPGHPGCGVTYRPESELLLLAKGAASLYSTWMCSGPQFPLEDFESVLESETD